VRAVGRISFNEAQQDLLYSYYQFETPRLYVDEVDLSIYRRVNRLYEHEVIEQIDRHRVILLLDNLNSFTTYPSVSGKFGGDVISMRVPLNKLVYVSDLLLGTFSVERKHQVLGGIFEARRERML